MKFTCKRGCHTMTTNARTLPEQVLDQVHIEDHCAQERARGNITIGGKPLFSYCDDGELIEVNWKPEDRAPSEFARALADLRQQLWLIVGDVFWARWCNLAHGAYRKARAAAEVADRYRE